ncbi:MAG: hypothetical protein ASARMPRED_005296 [Alectoria sarmentosa]|nr:MAG: hypothetical protein ASARMPRED_005296 [Alectoria sarmentosa]
MSDLIDLLSDLALLESTPSDMNQGAMSLIFNVKKQLDDFCAELTMSTNLAAALHHDDGTTIKIPSTVVNSDLFLPVNSGLEVPALSKSSEFRSGATDTIRMQANSNGNETQTGSRFEIMNGDHMVINALNHGLPTPQLTDTALERFSGTGPYYLSANNSSTSSLTSAGLSTIQLAMRGTTTQNKRLFRGASGRTFGANLVSDIAMSTRPTEPSNSDLAIRGNATQMKRALSEASSRIAAGGVQKKAKGDMDPENHEIYCLRQENRQFDEIAEIINNARSAKGRASNLTGNAIYARYKRNATLIASARGEVFKPCELDLHAGTNLKAITQPVPADFDDREDRLLVEAYKYVMENTWFLVSKRLEETTGRIHDPADCANRFAYL